MISKMLLLMCVISIVLLGFWTKSLRLENERLHHNVQSLKLALQSKPNCPPVAAAEAPAEVSPPVRPVPVVAAPKPAFTPMKTVAPFAAQIQKLKARLKQLNQADKQIEQRSKAYLKKENGGRIAQMKQIRTALAVVNESMVEAQEEHNRDEIRELRSRRQQLNAQLKDLNAKSADIRRRVSEEVAQEKAEVQTERTQIQRHLKSLESQASRLRAQAH